MENMETCLMRNITSFVLLFLTSIILADDPTKKIDTFGKEYLPYNEKLTLVYKSNFDETLSKTEIKNNIVILENKSDDFIYKQTFQVQDDGLYIAETYQKIKIFLFFKAEKKVTYNKNLLKIPYPVKTGQQWTCERTEYCDGDSNKVSLVSKCIGSEEITLEGGKFTTMKLETVVKSEDGSTNFVEEWIAPNVGLVKV
jgi:hypothetical protein